MNQPFVSIIVSCYNAEKYIVETLQSLVNQTYSNLEIIVVNDGSTDSSEQKIKSVLDGRIKYYFQTNKGQCAALNYGFSQSSGSLIKFYDADDLLNAVSIQAQVESLKGRSDFEISFMEWRRFYNDIIPDDIDKVNYNTIHKNCTPAEYLAFFKVPMVQCGIWLLPRGLLLKSGLWNERLSLINDIEFFARVLSFTSGLVFSEKGYTLYRTNSNSNSLSSDFSRKGIKSALVATDGAVDYFLKIENSDRIHKNIVNSYVLILEWAFPKHPVYVKLIEKRLKKYPKYEINYTKSGKAHNTMMALLGWKITKRLALIYYRFRYNKK